jgi:hypothetical protein
MLAANHPGSLVETVRVRLTAVFPEAVVGDFTCGLRIEDPIGSRLGLARGSFNPALEPRSFGTIEGLAGFVREDHG